MIKKLGININIDEARVLVASANSDPEFVLILMIKYLGNYT